MCTHTHTLCISGMPCQWVELISSPFSTFSLNLSLFLSFFPDFALLSFSPQLSVPFSFIHVLFFPCVLLLSFLSKGVCVAKTTLRRNKWGRRKVILQIPKLITKELNIKTLFQLRGLHYPQSLLADLSKIKGHPSLRSFREGTNGLQCCHCHSVILQLQKKSWYDSGWEQRTDREEKNCPVFVYIWTWWYCMYNPHTHTHTQCLARCVSSVNTHSSI